MHPTLTKRWNNIFRGIQDAEADLLYVEACRVPDNEIIVEIGSYKGSSAYAMSLACEGKNVKIYCIDHFMGSPGGKTEWPYDSDFYQEFKKNLKDEIEKGVVIPLVMSSAGGLMYEPKLYPYMIFIDGSHQYEDVLFDMTYWWDRVKEGGVMLVHDSTGHPRWHPQVKRALDKFVKSKDLEYELIHSVSRINK